MLFSLEMLDTSFFCMDATIVAVNFFVASSVFCMVLLLPFRFRFALAMVFSVPQLYVFSIGGVYPSIALLMSFSLFPEMMKKFPALLKSIPFILVCLLILFQILSFFWSSDIRLGVRSIAYEVPFLMFFSAAFQLHKSMPEFIDKVLIITCFLVLTNAVFVILFRLLPELECAYLNSGFAGLFAGPNTVDAILDGSERNNVIDPLKSGGFFVNANVAASYLGLSSLVCFYYWIKKNNAILLLVAVVFWVSIWFTGSKAGIILSVFLLPSLFIVFGYIKSNRKEKVILVLFVILLLLLIFFFILTIFAFEGIWSEILFFSKSVETTQSRMLIWFYALEEFVHSPILGQGFGGWQEGFKHYALEKEISTLSPPHNTFINLWSQSGLMAVVIAVFFIASVFSISCRLFRMPDFESRLLGGTLGLTAGGFFLQGMGENYGLLGEMHQLPLLSVLIGIGYAKCQQDKNLCRMFSMQSNGNNVNGVQ